MLGENFVYFFTVQGFFVGIVFGILKSFDAEGLLVYTFFITTFFYLFSHFIISFFLRYSPIRQEFFPKMRHEQDLDYYANEISKREKIAENSLEFISNLDKQYAGVSKVSKVRKVA